MALSAGIARRVLLVNHGYPPLYNAGSEVYTQTLALGLRRRGLDTAVFTREENHIKPDFVVTHSHDHIDPRYVSICAFPTRNALCTTVPEKPCASSHHAVTSFTVFDFSLEHHHHPPCCAAGCH